MLISSVNICQAEKKKKKRSKEKKRGKEERKKRRTEKQARKNRRGGEGGRYSANVKRAEREGERETRVNGQREISILIRTVIQG